MRILVDGDACPNKDEIASIANNYHISMIVFVDFSHMIDDDLYEVRQCSVGRDSADMQLLKEVKNNDIVITQDYGLASLALIKNAYVLHVSGMIIDKDNIDELLMRRYEGQKERKRNKHVRGPSKRTQETEKYFLRQLIKMIEEI